MKTTNYHDFIKEGLEQGNLLEIFQGYKDHVGEEYASVEDFEDSYSGHFASNEEFAQAVAESCGLLNKDLSWPHSHINWEQAARVLMSDYFEVNGYYFRHA